MKHCCKLFVFIGLTLLINHSFAQKGSWTLGFNWGNKIQMLEKTSTSDLNFKSVRSDYSHFDVSVPRWELNLTYNINERFFISSGFAYLNYVANWSIRNHNFGKDEWIGDAYGRVEFKYLQIPLNLKYAIPLGKSNFRVYGKLGFSFDIPVKITDVDYFNGHWKFLHYETGYDDMYYQDKYDIIHYFGNYSDYFEFDLEQTATIFNRKMNVLLNAGIGLGYCFKNGLGLSLEGEYYAGLRTMGHVLIEATPSEWYPSGLKKHSEQLIIRGNYWNFSLGISYTFKKKAKKNTTTIETE